VSPWHVISTLESKIDNRIRQTQKRLSSFQVPQFCFLYVAQKENCSSFAKYLDRFVLALTSQDSFVAASSFFCWTERKWRLHELSTISCIECDATSFCLQFQSKSDRNTTPLMDSSVHITMLPVSGLYSLEWQCGWCRGTLWPFAWKDWGKPRKTSW
jgi:hypothetical protein